MFKRRRFDDPAQADAALPAGIAPDADDAGFGRTDVLTAAPGDTGLGVPPFRPASSPKEAPPMSRPPFQGLSTSGLTPSGLTPSGPTPPPPGATNPGPQPRPGIAPQAAAPATRERTERRTLVVGRGISVQGTVQDAERLVVEGTVEASMIHAAELSISQGGMFKGEVEVEDAEVAGTFNGTLTARGNLMIRSSGRLLGQAHCRRLQVEDGGQLSGQMEMLTDEKKPEQPVRATEHAD